MTLGNLLNFSELQTQNQNKNDEICYWSTSFQVPDTLPNTLDYLSTHSITRGGRRCF